MEGAAQGRQLTCCGPTPRPDGWFVVCRTDSPPPLPPPSAPPLPPPSASCVLACTCSGRTIRSLKWFFIISCTLLLFIAAGQVCTGANYFAAAGLFGTQFPYEVRCVRCVRGVGAGGALGGERVRRRGWRRAELGRRKAGVGAAGAAQPMADPPPHRPAASQPAWTSLSSARCGVCACCAVGCPPTLPAHPALPCPAGPRLVQPHPVGHQRLLQRQLDLLVARPRPVWLHRCAVEPTGPPIALPRPCLCPPALLRTHAPHIRSRTPAAPHPHACCRPAHRDGPAVLLPLLGGGAAAGGLEVVAWGPHRPCPGAAGGPQVVCAPPGRAAGRRGGPG